MSEYPHEGDTGFGPGFFLALLLLAYLLWGPSHVGKKVLGNAPRDSVAIHSRR